MRSCITFEVQTWADGKGKGKSIKVELRFVANRFPDGIKINKHANAGTLVVGQAWILIGGFLIELFRGKHLKVKSQD